MRGLLDGLLYIVAGEGGEKMLFSHQTILSAKQLTSKSIQNMSMTNTCLLKLIQLYIHSDLVCVSFNVPKNQNAWLLF